MLNYYFFYLDTQISSFMNYSALYTLLPSLLELFDYIPNKGIWNSAMRNCWKGCLTHLKTNDQLPEEYREEDKIKKIVGTLPYNIQIRECLEKGKKTTTKYAFGVLDGYVWKLKFEEKMHFSNQNELS